MEATFRSGLVDHLLDGILGLADGLLGFALALLRDALGLADNVAINRSGGALAANAVMVAGLTRIGEAANQIWRGEAGRALAHATSGSCLQQNLVCVLEGA